MQNIKNLGYTEKLYILPFDHRTGLYKVFGWTEPLTDEQIGQMKDGRHLIYEAIQKAVTMGMPKEHVPVFTDDIFGKEVLLQAKKDGFMTFLTTEKSGVSYFDFQHGESFKESIKSVDPTFTKALVRYNVEGNKEDNMRSLENLKKLSDFSHEQGYKFVIEPLVIPTEAQLASLNGDKSMYDNDLRPELTVQMIKEMHNGGIEPDIWKIEGFKNPKNYEMVVKEARAEGRSNVGVISLGRNETDEVVESWLRAGAQVEGVIGFAVGRTIFLDSLIKFQNKEMTREQTTLTMANRLTHFYNVFCGK